MKREALLFFFFFLCAFYARAQEIELVGSSYVSKSIRHLGITKPAGTSAGDLILIHAGFAGSGSITIPSGFTEYVNDNPGGLAGAFCYRIADGSEGDSFTISAGNTKEWVAAIAVYRNVNLGSPFEDIDFIDATTNNGDTSFITPDVTAQSGTGLLLAFALSRHTGTPTNITTPAGMTGLGDTVGLNRMLGFAEQDITVSGATGTRTLFFSGAQGGGGSNNRRYFSVSVILRSRRILYSYQSGNFDSAQTWTLDPSGSTLTPSNGVTPGTYDSVVIKNGRVITLSADRSSTSIGLQLDEGAVLNLQTFTLDGLNSLSGKGRLRSSRTAGSVTYFPTAQTSGFLGSDGGFVEYYCAADVTLNTSVTGYHHLELKRETSGTTQYTQASNITLTGNLKLSRTGSAISRLTMGNNTTVRTLTVNGSTEIALGCEWRVGTGNASGGHAITVNGDLSNYGSLRFTNLSNPDYATTPATGYATVTFTGAANNVLRCYGQTDIYRMIVNKGTGQTYILSIESNDSTNFKLFGRNNQSNGGSDPNAIVNKALYLQNGTLQLNDNIYIPCLTTGGSDFYINQNAGLWINGAHVVATNSGTSARAIAVLGLLRLSSGRIETNTGAGLIYREEAEILIEGGYLRAGQFRPGTGGGNSASYTQTGGHVLINGQSDDNNFARFSLPDVGCSFDMSGGLLEVFLPTTKTEGNLIEISISELNHTVTGGEIRAVTNAARQARIEVTGPLYYLELDDQTGDPFIAVNPLTITDMLLIDAGNAALDMGNNDLTVNGDMTITNGASLTMGTGTLSFEGSNKQTFTVDGTLTGNLEGLTIDKSDTLLIAGSASGIVVDGTFSLLSGVLNDGGKTVELTADAVLSSVHTGTGKILLSTATTRTVSGNGDGVLGNLEYNASAAAEVTVSCALRLRGNLNFVGTAQRILDFGSNLFLLDTFATVTNAGSNRFVRFNGLQSAGGLTKIYSTDTFSFPIGTGTDYTPARISFSSAPSVYGSINVKPVAAEHPAVTANGRSLTYYWKTSSDGFDIGSAQVSQQYSYATADVITGAGITEGAYVPARFDMDAILWIPGSSTFMDTVANTVTFYGIPFTGIDGEYTAGDNSPDNPFGAVTVYYSRVDNGNWASASTWTKNPDHTTIDPPATPPNANSIIRIGNGHTIEVGANGAAAGSLFIGVGSSLDLNQTTAHDFVTVTGKGTLRIDRNGTTYIFPSGDFGTLLTANGGKVEYYNTTTSNVTLPSGITVYNGLKINAQSTGIIQFPPVNLTLHDSLIIASAATGQCYWNATNAADGDITINKALVVSSGILEIRLPSGTPAHYYQVVGDLRVDSGAVFRMQVSGGSNIVHTLELQNSLVNKGTFDLYRNDTKRADLLFKGADTSYITGNVSNATTELGIVTVNKGSNATYMLVVDVAGTLTTLTDAWLTLVNGTFRLSKTGYAMTIWDTETTFDVPASCAISVDAPTASILLAQENGDGADLVLAGKLEVLRGTINVGIVSSTNNSNNDIVYASTGVPEIIVLNGALNVKGQIRRSTGTLSGALYYKQGGSSVVTIYGRNADDTRGMLEVLNTGSHFAMSGTDTLYILRGGSATFSDLYLQPQTANVTGGNVVFQPLYASNSDQQYSINSSTGLYNVTIAGSNSDLGELSLGVSTLTVLNNLNIGTDGELITNNLDVKVGARFLKTGTYTGGTSLLRFTSTSGAIQGDFSTESIYKLELDSSSVLSVSGVGTSLRIDNTLSIGASAILHDSSHLVDLKGDVYNYGEHRSIASGSSNTLQFTGTSTQQVYGNGSFGNLVVNNGNTVALQGPVQINRQLTLTNGVLDINEYRLTLGATATTSGTFGSARLIRTNGALNDGGIRKICNPGANNVYFPVGVSGKYTPVRINITASNAAGEILVKPVNSKHPSTRVGADSQLNFYWQIDTVGFNTLTVTHTYEYIQSDVTGTEGSYVGGRFVSAGWSPLFGISGVVNSTSNTITLTGVSYINGNFTAGVPNEFAGVSTYYSRKSSGNWDDLDMWSITSHNGAALSSPAELPVGAPIIIASGDTVYITGNTKLAQSVELIGSAVLDISNTFGHNLGAVSGTGKLRIRATGGGQFVFPGGSYSDFTSSSGGTVEFYNSADGILPTQATYNRVIFKDASTRTQPNVDITVNGVITIEGGSFNNSSFNKNLTVKNNWVNEAGPGGYVPGQGKVTFAGTSAQTIDGVTKFYTLEFSGGGTKTLLDSITAGNQLLLNGGLVYLGSHNLVVDSLATSGGSPSATAMVVQNGSGRIVKKYKSGSPSFTFPLGEETGTVEYSPVTLVFNSGSFTSLANVRVELVDANSPACAAGSHYISRYWSFTSSGISSFSAGITAKYVNADVNGTESLISARMSRPSLPCLNGSFANTADNLLVFTAATALNILAGGEAPAIQPTLQATLLFFTGIQPTQMNLTWTKGNGQRRLVLARQDSAVNALPVDLTSYTADANFSGSPQNLGNAGYAVFSGSDSSFVLSGLNPSTTYHFAIFEYNNQGAETDYLVTTHLTGVMKTLATEPTLIATNVTFDRIRHTSLHLNWDGGNGQKKLVIAREGLPVNASPSDRTIYSANAVFGNGHEFAGQQFVVYAGASDSVTLSGLDQNTRYHFAIFEWNGTDSSSNYYAAQHLADSQHSYLLLELRVLLEGAFINTSMIANNQPNIPGAQPYSGPPYNFGEFNSIQSVPGDSLIDWVMIELRKSPTAAGAAPSTIRGRAAGFIRPDGRVDDTLAMPGIIVKTDEPGEFFVVVHHRTHISVMSSSHLIEPDQSHPYYGYNFTDSVTKAYGSNALVDLGGGKWGMFSGRAENNGTAQVIDDNDRVEMWNDRNKTGYQQTDVNLDGIVDAEDRSKVWNNRNVASQIPQ